jgi:hypothetical protein
MNATTPGVREFFEQYTRSRTAMDLDLIASQYPDAFMMAGPNGPRTVEKSMILGAFTSGQSFLKASGHKSTRVLSLDETRLDQRYVLVRAQFVWRFAKASAQPTDVTISSTFVLDTGADATKIVFQHEHEDFQQALRASGVLPPNL